MLQGILKQSTAVNITVLMIDSADHITGKTGLSGGLTIYSSKAAATPAAITPTVTEIDSTNVKGVYKLAFTSGHTDTLGELQLHITATGADPTDIKWQVSARLPDDLAFPATTGRSMVVDASGLVDANVVKVGPTGSGTAQTAADVGSLATETGADVDEIIATLGTPAGASLAADLAEIEAETDLIPGTQDGKTFAQTILLMASALLGKASGLSTTTAVYRAVDDSKDRVTATVDANGNRSAVTLDAT